MILFGKASLGESNIHVQRLTDYVIPERDVTYISIPGRNGDFVYDNGRFKNCPINYKVYVLDRTNGVISSLRNFACALSEYYGTYQRLEDDSDPEVYQMAMFVGPSNWTNQANVGGESTLKFSVKPCKWLKSGEKIISVLASGMSIHNPTGMEALPVITIEGTGSATLTVGEYTVSISEIGGSITLDSTIQDAYSGTENKNSVVTLTSDYPTLKKGNTVISFAGSGITAVKVKPNWWTL